MENKQLSPLAAAGLVTVLLIIGGLGIVVEKHDTAVAQRAYDRGKNIGYRLGQCDLVLILAEKPTDDTALRDRVVKRCRDYIAEHGPNTTETLTIP